MLIVVYKCLESVALVDNTWNCDGCLYHSCSLQMVVDLRKHGCCSVVIVKRFNFDLQDFLFQNSVLLSRISRSHVYGFCRYKYSGVFTLAQPQSSTSNPSIGSL